MTFASLLPFILILVIGAILIPLNRKGLLYGRMYSWVGAYAMAVGFFVHAYFTEGSRDSFLMSAMFLMMGGYEHREWKRRRASSEPVQQGGA